MPTTNSPAGESFRLANELLNAVSERVENTGISWRTAATEIGLSKSMLHRLRQSGEPDLSLVNTIKIARWLQLQLQLEITSSDPNADTQNPNHRVIVNGRLLVLTERQRSTLVSALIDKSLETSRYLSNDRSTGNEPSEHETCCDYHRQEYEDRRQRQRALQLRRQSENLLIEMLETQAPQAERDDTMSDLKASAQKQFLRAAAQYLQANAVLTGLRALAYENSDPGAVQDELNTPAGPVSLDSIHLALSISLEAAVLQHRTTQDELSTAAWNLHRGFAATGPRLHELLREELSLSTEAVAQVSDVIREITEI